MQFLSDNKLQYTSKHNQFCQCIITRWFYSYAMTLWEFKKKSAVQCTGLAFGAMWRVACSNPSKAHSLKIFSRTILWIEKKTKYNSVMYIDVLFRLVKLVKIGNWFFDATLTSSYGTGTEGSTDFL